jgi:hypothetical protein
MRRRSAVLPLALASLVLLTACGEGDGGSGSEETSLSQAQTAEVLLTQEEFPLKGYTRGTVTQQEDDAAEETAVAEDTLAALIEGQDVSDACRTALEGASFGEGEMAAESSVTFSGDDTSAMLAQQVELVVATTEGTSPLEPLADVNEECGELELEESGVSMTLSFAELEDLEGTRMTISAADQEFEMTMGGRTDGSTVVAVLATGVAEEDVAAVVDAQLAKIDETEQR